MSTPTRTATPAEVVGVVRRLQAADNALIEAGKGGRRSFDSGWSKKQEAITALLALSLPPETQEAEPNPQ